MVISKSNISTRIILSVSFFVGLLAFSSCDEQGTPNNYIVPIIDNSYNCEYLRWSPDGSKIAFWGDNGFGPEFFIWDKEKGNVIKLELYGPAIDSTPFDIEYISGLAWTLDGEYLLCSVKIDDYKSFKELWQVSIADGYSEKIEMPQGQQPSYPEVSPDGEWLTYSIKENEMWNVWKVAIQSGMPITTIGVPIKITFDGGGLSRWSPYGSKFAYYGNYYTQYSCLYTIPVSGGEPTLITPFDSKVREWLTWSPDGDWLVYCYNQYYGPMELWKIPSVGGTPQQITEFEEESQIFYGDSCPDWSPDGEWIAFISDGRNDGSVFLIKIQ